MRRIFRHQSREDETQTNAHSSPDVRTRCAIPIPPTLSREASRSPFRVHTGDNVIIPPDATGSVAGTHRR
ncbi:hypothetical protein KCP76_24940 [Salmonella enterica subsp. enterica serovar Weltevreden]|nr:hypothetical protein KCP76_24940 [Salmonella enterica subsp. enterica serovar Weltevreden]